MLPASLIVVNYHSADLVVAALRHIEAEGETGPCETIIVDNSPGEGLGTRLDSRVTYVAAPRNLGFAAAVNLGLEEASQETLILLNPDARPEPGCCAGLCSVLQETQNAGVAGPALIPGDGGSAALPSATRVDAGLWTVLAENTILRRLLPRDWLEHRYFLRADPESGGTPEALPAAMVQGACFALRREVVHEIGVFDDRFFFYWEETDFCRRARSAGFRVLYCPQFRCVHFGKASTRDPDAARRHFWYGLFAFWRKHYGLLRATLLRVTLVAGVAAEVAVLGTLRLFRKQDSTLQADFLENRERLRAIIRLERPEPMT